MGLARQFDLVLALVLVLEIESSIRRDSVCFDYDYEHERRFAEHEGQLAGKAAGMTEWMIIRIGG